MALSEQEGDNREANRQNSQSDLTHQQPIHDQRLFHPPGIGFRELLALGGFIRKTEDKLGDIPGGFRSLRTFGWRFCTLHHRLRAYRSHPVIRNSSHREAVDRQMSSE